MRRFQWLAVLCSVIGCANKPGSLAKIYYSTEDLNYNSHVVAADNYYAINLPYAPYENIRIAAESKLGLSLKHRGEAHITVISPPEYQKINNKLPMAEIESLARQMKLTQISYKPVCVGQGILKDSDSEKSTFFVVVEADQLFQFRKALQELYIKRGGNEFDFSYERYYPHITLGFTERDLHYEDGVIKDASSCLFSMSSKSN